MSGAPAAFNEMIEHMYKGANIAQLGILPSNTQVNWSDVIFNALTIKGITGRRMWETWYQMEQMLLGGLDLSPVITHRFKFDDFQKGFDHGLRPMRQSPPRMVIPKSRNYVTP